MNISTKGDYAIRGLVNLAMVHGNGKMSSIKDISAKEGVPKRYLENIFLRLKKAGIVSSVKGEKGGFKLFKNPNEITILEILNAVESKKTPSKCVTSATSCNKTSNCGIRRIWVEMFESNNKLLKQYTLEDIAKKGKGE
ncbi:MAG: Rrf2 family transcriptional regulator [bacterium]